MVGRYSRGSMELLEREDELRRLGTAVEAARAGSGRVAIVEGEAGVGKSALLAKVADDCQREEILFLRARGGELERHFGFGVVRQLLEPALRVASEVERVDLLDGAAALAAPVLRIAAASGDPPGPEAEFAVQHGLYWLAANLAARSPLLLCVDDAQWADTSSLRWLVYLARRLEGLALSVLVGWRLGEPDAPGDLLEGLRVKELGEVISVSALSAHGSARVVLRHVSSADAHFRRACHEATGGNPFLLGELMAELAAGDVEPTAEGAAGVRALGPASVARDVVLRLARLSGDAAALARAVAVLDTDGEFRFAAALAGLDRARASAAAADLVQARIFAPSETLRFTHPILRAAVYNDLPLPRRQLEHRRAAQILFDLEGDPDRAAVHLLATAPTGEIAVSQAAAEAAERALARGAPEAAFSLLERALAEPPAQACRSPLLLQRGIAAFMSGRPDAEAHLREAVSTADQPSIRAEAAMTLSQLEVGGRRAADAIVTLQQAIAELGDTDRARAQHLELYRLTTEAVRNASWGKVQGSMLALRDATEAGTWLRRVVSGCLIWQESLRPDGPRADALAALRIELGDVREVCEEAGPLDFVYACWAMMGLEQIDELEAARAGLDTAVASAQRAGHLAGLAPALVTRVPVLYALGELSAAEADARQVLNLGPLVGNNVAHDQALAWLCVILADQGELEAAEGMLSAHGLAEGEPGPTILEARVLYGRARLRFAEGHHALACTDLARFFARFGDYDGAPFGAIPAFCPRILAAGGEREWARGLLTRELAVTAASGVAGVYGMVLHSAAALERGEAAIDLLQQAVVTLERSPRRVELARALADLGGALRRANRRADAREPLRRAMELAHGCGANAIAERARQELVATGARPRRLMRSGVDALTASERRVAELAATGLSITEIAQSLFVTRKTIETHLYAAYRKLDVNTRAELAAAMPANAEAGVPIVD
jgi:DNA-binding CsgD family transcriptional regulator